MKQSELDGIRLTLFGLRYQLAQLRAQMPPGYVFWISGEMFRSGRTDRLYSWDELAPMVGRTEFYILPQEGEHGQTD